MGADYSFYVKFIATRAPTFLGYIISVLASVNKNDGAIMAQRWCRGSKNSILLLKLLDRLFKNLA